jgi:hypothetical protein
MSIETLLAELANEHTALHVNYDVARVRRLQQEAADAGAFFTCFSVAGTRSIYDLFDLVGEYLQFPEPTRNAEAVRDWATDLEFIDNEAGYVIVINDCQSLKDLRSEDLDLFFWLWPGGPAAFQFRDRIYHVLFTGPDPQIQRQRNVDAQSQGAAVLCGVCEETWGPLQPHSGYRLVKER